MAMFIGTFRDLQVDLKKYLGSNNNYNYNLKQLRLLLWLEL